MTVDRREFLYRVGAGAAALLPAALLAGCPKTEQTTVEPTTPAPPTAEGGPQAAAPTEAGGPILGADPADQGADVLAVVCPKCGRLNAFPGYTQENKPPQVKCRVCGNIWSP